MGGRWDDEEESSERYGRANKRRCEGGGGKHLARRPVAHCVVRAIAVAIVAVATEHDWLASSQ